MEAQKFGEAQISSFQVVSPYLNGIFNYFSSFIKVFMKAVFLDIETTGLDPLKHHAIEIAFKIIDLKQKKEVASYQSIINAGVEAWEMRDPVSTDINGFDKNKMLRGSLKERVAQEIVDLFSLHSIQRGKAVYICQNPAFDRTFFSQIVPITRQETLLFPYHWLDLASMYWGLTVRKYEELGQGFPETLQVSKNGIAASCHLPPETIPHSARNGVNHLIACYQAVIGCSFVLKAE